MTLRRWAGLLVVVGLFATGCSAPGTQRVEEGHWRLTLPADFQEQALPQERGRWTKAFQNDATQVVIAGRWDDQPRARAALAGVGFGPINQIENYDTTSITDIEIPGAYSGAVQRFTFTADGQTRSGAWIAGSQWPYPSTAVIAVSSREGALDEGTLTQLIDGLEWRQINE